MAFSVGSDGIEDETSEPCARICGACSYTRVAPRSAELTLLGALLTAHSSRGTRFTDMYIRILYNTDMYTEPHTIHDTQRNGLWAIQTRNDSI